VEKSERKKGDAQRIRRRRRRRWRGK